MKLQVGVKAFIKNNEGKYLFIHHIDTRHKKAWWTIPGGRIEAEEPLEEALKREVQEETGLIITGNPKLIAAQDLFPEGQDLHVVRLTYTAEAQGNINLNANGVVEHDEYKWVTLEEIKKLEGADFSKEAAKWLR